MAPTSQRALPRLLIAIAILLVIARIVVHVSTREKPSNDSVNWVSIEEAAHLAVSSNRPILMDFTAEWCGPCHVLDAEVFRDPAMAKEINERFIAVRVTDRQREDGANSEVVAELQRRYRVNGFPTVVFADVSGGERGRMEGYGGREQFRSVMESVR
ncbi:MAG TPA: thioredoxin fold domain-containing protein [Thermoanaerobaculia bacterium]|jgi:thioredoxin-related protein|nr:thioredoxin fold domain-containing protein [Thermoanaerobaculia bacterium]